MEEEFVKKPKYTVSWLGIQILFIAVCTIAWGIIAYEIDSLASSHNNVGLITDVEYQFLNNITLYNIGVIAITIISISLIELAVRKNINLLQYALIGCAICLFQLLLLAMTEHLPFLAAYAIVTVMTIALISCFINGLTKQRKAVALTTLILFVEYGLILTLLYIGSLALLIGSLAIFVLIALAMYFTLKLKVENSELVIK
jgi:inner membrane protein involved in colicin E2 resistance